MLIDLDLAPRRLQFSGNGTVIQRGVREGSEKNGSAEHLVSPIHIRNVPSGELWAN